MIAIPYNQKLIDKNEKHVGSNVGDACIICSAKIKNLDNHKLWVRIVNGGGYIGTVTEAEAEPSADLGYYPIGADCLKNNPALAEYVNDGDEVTTE